MTRLLIYAGIAAALIFGAWGYSAYQYRQGKAAGIAQERIAWEEARRRLLAQMEAERKAAQAAIDQIERDYLNAQDRDRKAISALESTIAELEKEDAGNAAGTSCHACFDGRLLRDLSPIGREDGTRPHP